jgi:hypothetical protein
MDRGAKVTDVECELVEHRFVVPWLRLIWWAVCVSGAAGAAYQLTNKAEVVVYVFAGAIIWPLLGFWQMLVEPKATEESAERLRSRLLGRPETIWARARVRRAPK